MSAMAPQITSLTIVHSKVYSRRRSKKTPKLRVTGLCVGNSPVTGEFPAPSASNEENASIWWRHHEGSRSLHYVPLMLYHIKGNWGLWSYCKIYVDLRLPRLICWYVVVIFNQVCKAQVTLCRSFFVDVPDHSRPPRSVMIESKPSNSGLNSRSLCVQDCEYDLSTTLVRRECLIRS